MTNLAFTADEALWYLFHTHVRSVIVIWYVVDGVTTNPRSKKREMAPTSKEEWFNSKEAPYDPLQHFWFWIPHILGV